MHEPDFLFKNKEGTLVPDVTFRIRRDGGWAALDTDGVFGGKTVVAFSLPGAFTPTCSASHLPRYDEMAPLFKRKGVDAVVCVAVNDPFVMEEWGRAEGVQDVVMLPDGNGEFTERMGMMADRRELGLGRRSWRYSMLVRDKRIEKMFIEPLEPGDPFVVSDADTMLRHLDPQAHGPDQVALLSRDGCPFCARARELLDHAGYDYVEIPLPHGVRSRTVGAIVGEQTVPQVFINGTLIGGSDALADFLRAAAVAA